MSFFSFELRSFKDWRKYICVPILFLTLSHSLKVEKKEKKREREREGLKDIPAMQT